MKKDSIVQFVCFITQLEPDEFAGTWEHYAKRFMTKAKAITLQQESDVNARYKYISQHEWAGKDFRFAFMEGRNSEHFPEQKVKVIQAGGYMPMQIQYKGKTENGNNKVMAFIGHKETDIEFYKSLPYYRHLNIYEAYFESCTYAYVLEFFSPESAVTDLLQQLKGRPSVEAAAYRKCVAEHA